MNGAILLLADPSPCLRLWVLRELLGRPDQDPEVVELAALRAEDPLVSGLIAEQEPDGSWPGRDLGWAPHRSALRVTAHHLARLGYLGFGPADAVVQRGAEYLFSLQRDDGAWDMSEDPEEAAAQGHYSMIPLQTALPLRGLAACGYATDARAERAYEWLLAQRLPDGAWPTGMAAGTYGYVAGYRRLAHSRWGCRSNTTGALVCLALHPDRRLGPEARRALDLLLGRETREEQVVGFDLARTLGIEPSHGFLTYYGRFDLALVLDLSGRVGASTEDERVADLVAFVRGLQGPRGLWEYAPRPQGSRWLTYELLRSLERLAGPGGWTGDEPRTPFRPYPRRVKRY